MRFSHNVIVHNFLYLARNIYEPNPYPSRMGVARRILKKEVLNCEKRKDNGRQYSRGVYFIRIHRSSCHLPDYPFVTDGGICR